VIIGVIEARRLPQSSRVIIPYSAPSVVTALADHQKKIAPKTSRSFDVIFSSFLAALGAKGARESTKAHCLDRARPAFFGDAEANLRVVWHFGHS